MLKSESSLLKTHNGKVVRNKTLLGYSVIFALMALFIYGVFFGLQGRSLVLAPDGLSQHVTILAYYGNYLRTILRNIFVEHTFVIPMFDFSIGFGGDIVSTLHYYGVGDPLNLLSVFVSEKNTEYLYAFLAVLRMYIAGLTFSAYMLHRNSHPSAIVTGAVSYAFSGFALRASTVHPFFMTGMMYLPLIFLGIDRILEKKSPVLYIVSIALILVTNFYFAYMACIFMLIYAAMRYFEINKKAGGKVFAKTVGSFAVYTVVAFCMSMIIFLPQIGNVLSTNRLNTDNLVTLFYGPSYYTRLLDAMTNTQIGDYWVAIGYTGVTLLCIIMCFVRSKKYKNTVIGFVLSIIALLFPVFGHIFNGFTYVTNRWIWIMAFIGSVALVNGYDDLFELNPKEKKSMWIISVAYVGLFCIITESRSELSLLMLVLMFAVLCLVTIFDSVDISKVYAKRIVSLFLVAGVLMQVVYRYDFREGNMASDYLQSGSVYETMCLNTTATLLNRVDDGSEFFRYDDNNNAITENASILGDVNSTAFYYSVANSYVSQFISELGLNTSMEQRYLDLDDRYIMQSVLGVKYASNIGSIGKLMLFLNLKDKLTFFNQITIDEDKSISYYKGYNSHTSGSSTTYGLAKLKYPMPMGYTYDSAMSREEYEKLSAAEKQNVLLQTAVTDDTDNLPSASIRSSDVKQYDIFELIKNQAKETDGIVVNGNSITVTDTSAKLEITVPVSAYSECYMGVENLSYSSISPYDTLTDQVEEAVSEQQMDIDEYNAESLYTTEKKADLDSIAQTKLNYWSYLSGAPSTVKIAVKSDYLNNIGTLSYYTPKNSFYSGFDTFMVNLGYTTFEDIDDEQTDTITIAFNNVGTYMIDNWYISYQSLDNIIDDYTDRTKDVLENVEITDSENTVKGSISLDETKILATQIPYSEGWTAYVDGVETEILNVNTMFCGLLLEPGDHEIEFRYVTPYAGAAVAASVAGVAGLVVIAIIWKRKAKNNLDVVSE